MTLQCLAAEFSVCQITEPAQIDWTQPLCFVDKTADKLSLVCPTQKTAGGYFARNLSYS